MQRVSEILEWRLYLDEFSCRETASVPFRRFGDGPERRGGRSLQSNRRGGRSLQSKRREGRSLQSELPFAFALN